MHLQVGCAGWKTSVEHHLFFYLTLLGIESEEIPTLFPFKSDAKSNNMFVSLCGLSNRENRIQVTAEPRPVTFTRIIKANTKEGRKKKLNLRAKNFRKKVLNIR